MFQRLIALLLCLCCWAPAWPAAAQQPPTQQPLALTSYLLGHGDILHISILEQPNLINPGSTLETITIRPDGKITLPLVGEIQAAGLTVGQLAAALTLAYKKYFATPHVTINVQSYRNFLAPVRITVMGQVGHSGRIDFEKPPNLLEALAQAGGFSDRADRSHISIYRFQSPGKAELVDYVELTRSGRAEQVVLQSGDVIEVPKEGSVDFYQLTPILLGIVSVIVSIIAITRR